MNSRSGAAALAVLALAGCGRRSDPSSIVASGHVEATDVRIATKVAGRLESLALQEGDAVKAGQELARIETTDLMLALRQARAERDQAAAEYQLRLAGARKEDIAELEAQVASVQADLENAQKDFERMQGLLDRGSGTTKARDDAKARRDMTAHRLEAAKQALRASWHQDLAGAMSLGYWTTAALHHTDDFQERVEAFVNRKSRS